MRPAARISETDTALEYWLAGLEWAEPLARMQAVDVRTSLADDLLHYGDRMSMATIEEDGSFLITDVMPGEIKVTVEEDPTAARHGAMSHTAPPGETSGGKQNQAMTPVVIPEKYRNVQASGLVFTITPQTTEVPIRLD